MLDFFHRDDLFTHVTPFARGHSCFCSLLFISFLSFFLSFFHSFYQGHYLVYLFSFIYSLVFCLVCLFFKLCKLLIFRFRFVSKPMYHVVSIIGYFACPFFAALCECVCAWLSKICIRFDWQLLNSQVQVKYMTNRESGFFKNIQMISFRDVVIISFIFVFLLNI